MNVICLDIGTTAAKAAAFRRGRRVGPVLRHPMPMRLAGGAAELDPHAVLPLAMDLLRRTGAQLDGRVDRIAVAAMSPAVCLLDRRGRPISPIICHLDRRSEPEAVEVARRFGRRALLRITGNLPIPGGVASTVLRWLQVHEPGMYRRAARVVPLSTLLTSRLAGAYACDPGTAAFLGAFQIKDMHPWRPMLDFLELSGSALPAVRDGAEVVGCVKPAVAAELRLRSRPHVLVGLMDTSAVCVHAGLRVGRMYDVIGATDVLAICTPRPKPREGVLTRPVGTGPLWLAIHTTAAAGAAIDWTHRTFFADLPDTKYFHLVTRTLRRVARADLAPARGQPAGTTPPVEFEPDLAGSRMHVEQRHAVIRGLALSTTREQILAALLAGLARHSRQRLEILRRQARPDGTLFVAGGAGRAGLQRLWASDYTIQELPADASLRGLAELAHPQTPT